MLRPRRLGTGRRAELGALAAGRKLHLQQMGVKRNPMFFLHSALIVHVVWARTEHVAGAGGPPQAPRSQPLLSFFHPDPLIVDRALNGPLTWTTLYFMPCLAKGPEKTGAHNVRPDVDIGALTRDAGTPMASTRIARQRFVPLACVVDWLQCTCVCCVTAPADVHFTSTR